MGKLEGAKKAKLVHPNSRKAAALVKKKIKVSRRETKKQQGQQRLRLLAERLVWFRDNLDSACTECSLLETHGLIQRYIARHESEVEELRAKAARAPAGRRPQPQPRLEALEATNRAETAQFRQGGFECADLTCPEAVLYLRAWGGEVKLVPQIKTRVFLSGHIADAPLNTTSEDVHQVAAGADAAPEGDGDMSEDD